MGSVNGAARFFAESGLLLQLFCKQKQPENRIFTLPSGHFLFPSKRIFTIRYLPDPLTVHSKTNFLICFCDLQILSSTESPVS